jgi:hypothetical protein
MLRKRAMYSVCWRGGVGVQVGVKRDGQREMQPCEQRGAKTALHDD